jgi:hypothetical protein
VTLSAGRQNREHVAIAHRPGGTDKSIMDKLNGATNQALKAPDVVHWLVKKGGNEIVGGTPEDFLNVIKPILRATAN